MGNPHHRLDGGLPVPPALYHVGDELFEGGLENHLGFVQVIGVFGLGLRGLDHDRRFVRRLTTTRRGRRISADRVRQLKSVSVVRPICRSASTSAMAAAVWAMDRLTRA